jgi:DMSO/TMAO reductase YedYZ molybdopterin-dependent catalytic subunit
MRRDDPIDEVDYVESRAAEYFERQSRRHGRSRREMLKLTAAAVPALTAAALFAQPATAKSVAGARRSPGVAPAVGTSPIVKPLPPEWFVDFGTNAEMRWDSVDPEHYLTPVERFFVRDHTATPLIDRDTWRLDFFGSGLRGGPTSDRPRSVTYRQLRELPHRTITTAIECAGNGRSYFGSQQGTPITGTQWGLGAIGVAEWTGVPLSLLLERAGITRHAVDVMPVGLDANVVTNGTDSGHVRRPFPVAKAFDDVLVAYAMNGRLLTPDHGAPVRIVVPGWVGVANIKWVGQLEVSAEPLFSTWNTTQYRLIGPDYPADSPPLTNQVVKSAFELAQEAQFQKGREVRLTGRSWSGRGRIAKVDVSTDGGRHWRRARLRGPDLPQAWSRWELPWRPTDTGPGTLLARATDTAGRTQPATVPYNSGGYLFGAVVKHPVTVT